MILKDIINTIIEGGVLQVLKSFSDNSIDGFTAKITRKVND